MTSKDRKDKRYTVTLPPSINAWIKEEAGKKPGAYDISRLDVERFIYDLILNTYMEKTAR